MTFPSGDMQTFDPTAARADFPALAQEVNGYPLIYLDSAASTQKPRQVLDAIQRFYMRDNANVQRSVHQLGRRATEAYESARARVQRFINARTPTEIVFVRGTTEAINLVAYGLDDIGMGDEILVTEMEHHSNLLPWQELCRRSGATLKAVPINDDGTLAAFESMFSPNTRLFAFTHLANATGTRNDVKAMVKQAHAHGIPCLVDGAQAIAHLPVDVQELDCDFYAFSGHKLYGPSGIGVLYGKHDALTALHPFQTGGGMVLTVSMQDAVYADPPVCFEAGTPDIAGAAGLAEALDYITTLGLGHIRAYEKALHTYALERLKAVDRLQVVGSPQAGVISFAIEGIHPHDIATLLDERGIAVRGGHHCAQPLLHRLGYPATTRLSIALYNTRQEIDSLADALPEVIALLG